MSITPPTVTVPTPAPAPLSIRLPGGLVVSGVPTQLGASGLTQALALVSAAGPAMAPLGPIFSIIDAVLSFKDFAQAVPELLTNPGALIEAIAKLVQKIGRLLSLVPQLSVPLMVLDVIDALISLLASLVLELRSIEVQQARITAARATAATLAPAPRTALEGIADQAEAATAVQLQDIATALAGAGPLVGIVNALVGLLGLPGLDFAPDTSGGVSSAIDNLNALIVTLQTFRRTIPA